MSVTDLVDITKVILSMQSYFSADDNDQPESLWRFVSADFASVSIEDALEEVANYESINYNTLDGDVSDADFIGIKLGGRQHGLDAPNHRRVRTPETTMQVSRKGC